MPGGNPPVGNRLNSFPLLWDCDGDKPSLFPLYKADLKKRKNPVDTAAALW